MADTDKFIRIDENLHLQTKIAATLEGISIKEWTERALRHALDGNGKRLTDTRVSYETEAS